MKVAVCLFVGMDARARFSSERAARFLFPEALLKEFDTLEDALKSGVDPGGELLVFAHPDTLFVSKTLLASDARGLRRWAIVVLGATPPAEGVEIVSAKECNESLLIHAFRSAVAQYRLIRQKERLQGDLRTLAYRISHDLRTPLSGILSAGEALKEVLAEHKLSQDGLTKPLFSSVDDLEKLIERVSMLTRASLNPLSKTTVAMKGVIEAVLQRQERQILKRNAVVTQPDDWPEVQAVSPWLETVWGNLLSNALRHGGEAARIELGWRRNERELHFWMTDNGQGVPSEKCRDLFQPFHALHHANARNGLGLSIVQRLVELQGGTCESEAAAGGGATFYFTLPAERHLIAPLAPSPDPHPNVHRETQA